MNRMFDRSNEHIDECKAAFICITNNSYDKIKNKSQLLKALQCCGRNPNSKRLDSYWEKHNKNGIDFDEFCKIAEREEQINEKDLIRAFQTIDKNKDGFISFKELFDMLTNKGDKMSKEEVQDILNKADSNKDGKLDYKEFTKFIIETIDTTKDLTIKQMKMLLKEDDNKGKKSRENSRSRSPGLNGERSKQVQSPLSTRSNRSISNRSRLDDSDDDIIIDRNGANSRNSDRSILKKNENLNSSRNKKLSNSDSEEDVKQRKKSHQDNVIEIKLDAPIKTENSFQQPKNLKKWITSNIKGAFFLNDKSASIFSNTYILDLSQDSKVFFEIEPYLTSAHKNKNFMNMDILLMIVSESKAKARRLKEITENKIKNKWCVTCELKAGRYFLHPYTSGCYLKKRKNEHEREKDTILVTRSSKGKDKPSEKYLEALNAIFEVFDLDSNSRFNKRELELYTNLSEGGDLDDDSWNFIGEKVGFEKNELTRDGFIELTKIEIHDGSDNEDLWTRLLNLGFNKNLELDQCCPYNLTLSIENNIDYKLFPDELTKLSSIEPILHDYMQSKGKPINLSQKNFRDIGLFEYHNSYLSTLLIENSKNEEIKLKISDDGSENCIFDEHIDDEIRIKSNKKKIVLSAMAKNESKNWKLKLSITD